MDQGNETAHAVKNLQQEIEEKGRVEVDREEDDVRENEKQISDTSSNEDFPEDLRKIDSNVIKIKDERSADELLEHLPEHEREIIKRQIDIPTVLVTFKTLYRYATKWDMIIIAVSSLSAIIAGAAMPMMTVLFGQLTGTFQGFLYANTISASEFRSTLNYYTLFFVYLAIAEFITIYICTLGFIYTGEHIAAKIREQYLKAILRQNVGFFDKLGSGEITTRITADTNLIQEGISEKIGLTLTALATFITAFVIGFVKYWKLTLILTSTIFAIATVMGGGSTFIIKYNKHSLESYAIGGSVAEEVISSIRNAIAFGTQDKLARQYERHLKEASKWGLKVKVSLACMIGGMFLILYLNYGLSFWMGSKYIVSGETSLNSVITILMAVMIGALSLGNVAPNAQAFTTGVAAAAKIFNTIDRISPLDSSSESGDILEHVEGNIELEHIKHIYPSRPEVLVMQDVSINIPAGKTTALVGASGSGKSTVIGLVERFYNPVGGRILLDGHDIQGLNLKWLRRQISLVQQEPVLFATTIEANIAHGLIGTSHENASEEKKKDLIINAAKMANAHDFISALPEGYETNVGERGFLLSGGQKQRIAIARAIVCDPKILLLDEATSALDTKSEGVVQAALDVAAQGRTTIVIAHRLSTIKNADNIVVMTNGTVVEQGKHDELLENRASYYNLVEAQKFSTKQQEEHEEEIDEVEAQLDRAVTHNSIGKSQTNHDDAELKRKLDRTTSTQSVSSAALKSRQPAAEGQYSLWTLIKLVASFNKPEMGLMLIGLFFSIICGAGNPTQAVFFAEAINALALLPDQYDLLLSRANFWSLMYLMLAFVQFTAFLAQGWAFAVCSERLVYRVRDQSFRTMLRQDISFFDKTENSAGALTSFLSTESTHTAGMSGSTLGTIITVFTTLVAALVVATAIGWKLALVCTATIPIVLACGFFRFWILARFQTRSKKAYNHSATYACEATSAIRTVASLTREEEVSRHYKEMLASQGRTSLISVAKSSLLYAGSQSFMFLAIALGFWYGGVLIGSREYNLFTFFVCFSAVIFGAQSAGTIFSFAPDMGKAKHAAHQLKVLFDLKPTIDTWSTTGDILPVDSVSGTIEFRDVHFRYPTRPEVPVLRGLNLTIKPGQYIALVGASGCGKSTTIQLLERFYDPLSGGIFLDNKEISSYNINNYRSFLALVSQEPTLYQGTIRENICLGTTTPDTLIPESEITTACVAANIHTFITSLPDGLETIVGTKGSMLSGGQKQRIAIARALLRNPKVLLLDEATSALDSESEKVVQQALDAAARGRTTIAVAHRLSTIQKADVIYVFDQGRVVESGSHTELMARRGKYAELVGLQSLGKLDA